MFFFFGFIFGLKKKRRKLGTSEASNWSPRRAVTEGLIKPDPKM
jgi:hypothetical protein